MSKLERYLTLKHKLKYLNLSGLLFPPSSSFSLSIYLSSLSLSLDACPVPTQVEGRQVSIAHRNMYTVRSDT